MRRLLSRSPRGRPDHPGENLLAELFFKTDESQPGPSGRRSKPPAAAHWRDLHGARAIFTDTALRLGRYFGIEPPFWLNLQSRYDLPSQVLLGNEVLKRVGCGEARTAPRARSAVNDAVCFSPHPTGFTRLRP